MAWEQDISQQINTLEKAAVRFDTSQNLTSTQETTAKTNIGFSGASVTQIEGSDYKIVIA